MSAQSNIMSEMNERSREVFRRVVEGYLQTGEPMGSRSLTREMSEKVSAATIRNVMQDLEFMGLLNSPHVSAGRLPTQAGLRLFVDGLMEVGTVDENVQEKMQGSLSENQMDPSAMLDRVGQTLSTLTNGASLVLTPKHEAPLKHVELVNLAPGRALVVLVYADGQVENRVFTPPAGQTPSSLQEATNFLNALLNGQTLGELRENVRKEIQTNRQTIDALAAELIEDGAAFWEDASSNDGRLIVRGRSNLLEEDGEGNISLIRSLFDDLEKKQDIAEFLELTDEGEGVRIFIGSENKLFSLSGSSLVVSPYMNADRKIIGAVGVIGPTRLNYGRIVPIVDYTAQLVGKVLSSKI